MAFRTLPAQVEQKVYAYAVGAEASKGFIIRHSPVGKHLAVSHPVGVSFYLHQQALGRRYYEKAFGYPDVGLAFSYFDYRNPVLGKSLLLSTYLLIPVWRLPQAAFKVKIGAGLAYHTHPHDRLSNNSNIALGTPLGFSMVGAVQYYRQLSERWAGQVSLTLTHFSNGALSQPNLGINMAAIQLGLSRQLRPMPRPQAAPDLSQDAFTRLYYSVTLSMGARVKEYGGSPVPFTNLWVQTNHRFSAMSAINLGADLFFQQPPWQNAATYDQRQPLMNLGLAAGHELFYGRISLLTQLGVYLHRSFDQHRIPVYQRYGLRYAWAEHLTTSCSLKAHGGQAEYIEWGIGIEL